MINTGWVLSQFARIEASRGKFPDAKHLLELVADGYKNAIADVGVNIDIIRVEKKVGVKIQGNLIGVGGSIQVQAD